MATNHAVNTLTLEENQSALKNASLAFQITSRDIHSKPYDMKVEEKGIYCSTIFLIIHGWWVFYVCLHRILGKSK